MNREEFVKHLDWLAKDTHHLNDMAKSGYREAIKRVKEYVDTLPLEMTKEQAAAHLTAWCDYVTDKSKKPFLDEPCTDDEILMAMRMGAEALTPTTPPTP